MNNKGSERQQRKMVREVKQGHKQPVANEHIPLLAKLLIVYECEECGEDRWVGRFYEAMDYIVNHVAQPDGRLLCEACQTKASLEAVEDKPVEDKGIQNT